MSRSVLLRPCIFPLEPRWLPTAGPYPDVARNALQASYVSQAEQADNPVVFLGDSITYNWGTTGRDAPGATVFAKQFAPLDAANFGIIGDTTSELASRIEGGDLAGKPKVAVVLIGFNDLNQGSTAAQTAAGVASILADIGSASPSTSIILLGTLPSDDSAVNPEIQQLDGIISQFGNEPGVTYLNPGSLLLGPGEAAQADLLIDGVHPDLAGYNLIAGAIDGTVVKLLSEANYIADRPLPGPPPTTITPAPISAVPTTTFPVGEPVPTASVAVRIPIPMNPAPSSTTPDAASLERSVVVPPSAGSGGLMVPAVDVPDIVETPSLTKSRSDTLIVGLNQTN